MHRLTLLACTAFALGACDKQPVPGQSAIGDAHRGRKLVASIGCGACHEIPGILNARGLVGPPLGTIGERTMVAGVMPNTPANLIRWVQSPQQVIPGNAMPDMGLDDRDARDVAAYLYTLR